MMKMCYNQILETRVIWCEVLKKVFYGYKRV